ncbi:MAG: hypothetical protein ABI054_08060, partial [Planctomycetota bacterium]
AGVSYVQIAAGQLHGLARRSDGVVVAWGNNTWGQTNVPPLTLGLSYVDIAAGASFSAARRSDGVVRVWGNTSGNLLTVPVLGANERMSKLVAGESSLAAVIDSVWSTYCSAKLNSLGCLPAISATGDPRASLASGFIVRGSLVRNQVVGLLLYTVNGNQAATPFQCATLCVGPGSVRRTPGTSAGGTLLPATDCSGVYSIDMNAFAAGAAGGNPSPALLIAGTRVNAQWWGRDNGFAVPCNTTLTDGLEYGIGP